MSEYFEGGQLRRRNLMDEKYSDVIMTVDSNAVMMDFMYRKGFAKHAGYMTRGEALAVTTFQIYNQGIISTSTVFTFDEFIHFKNYHGSGNGTTTFILVGNFAINLAGMKSITLPDQLTSISNGALRASGYTRLVLPKHLSSISARGIQNTNLQKLVSLNPTPPTISATGWPTQAQIYVPDAAVDTYKAASIWSNYAANINPLSDYDGIIINEI